MGMKLEKKKKKKKTLEYQIFSIRPGSAAAAGPDHVSGISSRLLPPAPRGYGRLTASPLLLGGIDLQQLFTPRSHSPKAPQSGRVLKIWVHNAIVGLLSQCNNPYSRGSRSRQMSLPVIPGTELYIVRRCPNFVASDNGSRKYQKRKYRRGSAGSMMFDNWACLVQSTKVGCRPGSNDIQLYPLWQKHSANLEKHAHRLAHSQSRRANLKKQKTKSNSIPMSIPKKRGNMPINHHDCVSVAFQFE